MARVPKPKAIIELHGDKNKRRQHPEPTPSPHKPVCPATLDDAGRKHWEETVRNLDEMGLLSRTDTDSIALYCEAWSRYRHCEQFLKDNGTTYELSNGYLQPRHECHEMYKNLEICRRYQIEFGLTPSARSRIGIQTKKTASTWGSFFEDAK